MKLAPSIDHFLACPLGSYVAGRSYVVWVHDPSFVGNIHFGRPDEKDLGEHQRMFDLPAHPLLAPRFDVLIDVSSLEGVDLACYELLVRYMTHDLPRFARRVRKLAVIPPAHFIGAITIGTFHQLLAPQVDAQLFSDHGAAFDWLDHTDSGERRRAFDALLQAVAGAPAWLEQLRAQLRASTGERAPRLGDAARVLGTSERSLQRELQRAGTSFRDEVQRVRLGQAEALLLDSELKIEAIARRVGCLTAAHFCDLFRRSRGLSPAQFRARGRAQKVA